MSAIAPGVPNPAVRLREARARLNAIDRRASLALRWLCFAGGAIVLLAMIAVAYEVINGASQAIGKFGPGFLIHKTWNPVVTPRSPGVFGALSLIYGTLITSVFALILATALGVAIAIYLAMLAPKPVAAVVGPLVELLAAVPSIVIGFIGIIVIAPFSQSTLEPALHTVLGWIPLVGNLFGPVPQSGLSLFTAALVLTIMVVPIISALCRDMFLTVPRELQEGAEALGATRWEVIRGVVLPTTTSGIVAACVLGFGRATGEAIAVAQVIGGVNDLSASLFNPGNSLASAIAIQFGSPDSALHTSALYYCGVVVFVIGLVVNLLARQIAAGFRTRMALG